LYAGKKITLGFNSVEERENFRTLIYKKKAKQDIAIEAVLDEPKQTLKCKFVTTNMNNVIHDYILTFWVEEKKPVTYSIISIEETNDTRDNRATDSGTGEKISKDLDSSSQQSTREES
jgi:hypothetical protein